MVGEAIIPLRIVQPAGDEAGEHAPILAAGFEQAERERLAGGMLMRRAGGLEELGQPFGDGAVAGDRAIAAPPGGESLGRRGEDKLEGHQ